MHVEEGESQLGIPVREIKGIGEKTEKLLAKLDIETVDQLVHHSLLHDLSRANFHIRDKDRTKMFD